MQSPERWAWTIGRCGAKNARAKNGCSEPVWCGKMYRAHRRKDGKLVWKLDHFFGGSRSGRAPSKRYLRELTALMTGSGADYIEGLVAWDPVEEDERC